MSLLVRSHILDQSLALTASIALTCVLTSSSGVRTGHGLDESTNREKEGFSTVEIFFEKKNYFFEKNVVKTFWNQKFFFISNFFQTPLTFFYKIMGENF